jgi:hypothetical protein
VIEGIDQHSSLSTEKLSARPQRNDTDLTRIYGIGFLSRTLIKGFAVSVWHRFSGKSRNSLEIPDQKVPGEVIIFSKNSRDNSEKGRRIQYQTAGGTGNISEERIHFGE